MGIIKLRTKLCEVGTEALLATETVETRDRLGETDRVDGDWAGVLTSTTWVEGVSDICSGVSSTGAIYII